MAMSNWSGPINSENGFITPITYVYATDIVNGEFYIPSPGAKVLILSQADGGPTGAVDFILPNVTLPDGVPAFTGPNTARPELNGIQGSITNYGADRTYTLKGYNGQLVSGQASVTIGTGTVVQWGGNGNPNAPWLAISNNILVA